MLNRINESYIDGNGNIVIQEADNSTITINISDSEQVRVFFIEFQKRLSELPREILTELQKHNKLETELKIGANIYLTIIAAIVEMNENQVLWGISITNLTKEIRYFNQPYFKVFPTLQLGEGLEHDTFMMFAKEQIQFPVRLEYGQVLSLTYQIIPNQFQVFKNNASDEAFIQAYCGTTVGELYNSNEYKLGKLVNDYEAIRRVK